MDNGERQTALCHAQVSKQCKEAGAPSVDVYQTDLTDPKAVSELAEKLKTDHHGLDVLVNNAGKVMVSL